ncbi:lysophosphatidic acid receptor 6-like [Planococcus citri]|uniref:lysophosphatidic acid receptor 6-like n=1 Tax=Planococcus citri TaxID=170843 RepID=UPI0031F989CD
MNFSTATMQNTSNVCDSILDGPMHHFKDNYLMYICPYPNFISSVIGSFLNILNIVVFTRKNMASTMTTIFLHLSIVDLATLLIYIPTTWHICVQHNTTGQHVLAWERFHLFSRCTSSVLYYASAWFTVMLAIWRYMAIVHPFKEHNWCNEAKTRIMLVAGYVIGFVLSVPLILSMQIEDHKQGNSTTSTTIEYNEESLLYSINFVLYGAVLKLLPSIVLTICSYKLIRALFDVKDKHAQMVSNEEKVTRMKKKTDFTTKMLFGVLVLFLLSEVPTGVLGLFSIIYGCQFRKHYFSPMVHVFNTIRLINISVPFFVYYNLSEQFRKTFQRLFNENISPVSSNKVSKNSEILNSVEIVQQNGNTQL